MVTPEVQKAFGLAVREARVAEGWTLKKLAEMAFANPDRRGFVSQIENGRRVINPLTVGKLAHALDLPESVTRPMLSNDRTATENSDDDTATQTDLNAEALLREKEALAEELKLSEALTVALAYRYAETNPTDMKGALAGLEAALEAAEKLNAAAALKSNVTDAVDQVLDRMAELNAAGDPDGAAAALDAALAEEDEVSKARRLKLLEIGLEQDVLRGNAESAAARYKMIELVEHVGTDTAAGKLFNHGVQRAKSGRYSRNNFELRLALQLFLECSRMTNDQRNVMTALNSYATTLALLAERGTEKSLLDESYKVFTRILKKTSKRKNPTEWAIAQNNIGNLLLELAKIEKKKFHLKGAIKAYRLALTIRVRHKFPRDWATTQGNLGNALHALGQINGSTKLLHEAVDAYQSSDEEINREEMPFDWALNQNNLAVTLVLIGKRENNPSFISQAIIALNNALEERTRDTLSVGWARSTINLANALVEISYFEKDVDSLNKAKKLFEDASAELPKLEFPMDWATIRLNLASTACALFDKTEQKSHLIEAAEYVASAREVFMEAQESYNVEMADDIMAAIASRHSERD